MNNEVKPPEESDFPRMHLAVVEGDNHIESPYHYSKEELTIAFVNPYTKEEFRDDLQFVIEVEGQAEFVGGGSIGCENRRVSARMYDPAHEVQLKITDMTSKLRLWAGWATGQEAIRLTENLILEPHTTTGGSVEAERGLKKEVVEEENSEPGNPVLNGEDSAGEGLENSEPENPVLNEEESSNLEVENSEPENPVLNEEEVKGKEAGGGVRDDPSGKLAKIQQIKEQIKKFKDEPKGSPKYLDESDREEEEVEEDGSDAESEYRKRFHLDEMKDIMRKANVHPVHHAMHIHKKVHEIGKKIHDKYLYDEEKQQSFRQQYESDEFAGSLDATRHIVGSIFFLVAMGYIIFMYGRKRGTKGRRDL